MNPRGMNTSQTEKIWYQWSKLAATTPARFHRYGEVDRSKISPDQVGDAALDALAKVAWNTALAEALTPVLQAAEIGLRNWMDAAIRAFQKEQGDQHADEWLLHPPGWMHAKDREARNRAVEKLDYEVGEKKRARYSHNDVVATVSFVLWSNMLLGDTTWAALARHNGGKLTQGTDKKSLHKVFDDVRNLRNRAYHLEPLFLQKDLLDVYEATVRYLELLDPRLSRLISSIDRFRVVFGNGEGWKEIRTHLYDFYGLREMEHTREVV